MLDNGYKTNDHRFTIEFGAYINGLVVAKIVINGDNW